MEGGAAASSGHDGQQQPPPPPPLSQEEEESASASLPNDGPQAVREERLGSIGAEEKERGQDLPPSTTARRARRRGRRQGGEGSSDGSIEEGGATAAGGGGGGGGNGNEDGGRSVQPLPPTPGDSGGNGGLLSPLTIVLVGGFLLPPGEQFHTLYWGEALTAATGAGGGAQHRILCVHPGPIASLHDRYEVLCLTRLGCFGDIDFGLHTQWTDIHSTDTSHSPLPHQHTTPAITASARSSTSSRAGGSRTARATRTATATSRRGRRSTRGCTRR